MRRAVTLSLGACIAWSASSHSPATVKADTVVTWAADMVGKGRGALCVYGSEDCNACADDVLGAWNSIAHNTYGTRRLVTPNGHKGDVYVPDFNVASHFEGMTRFQPNIWPNVGAGAWYVHSYGGTGSNNVSGQVWSFQPATGGAVTAYRREDVALSTHWAGLQALGKYLFVSQQGGQPASRILIKEPGATPDDNIRTIGEIQINFEKYTASVGAAKLFDGSYIAVNNSADDDITVVKFASLHANGGAIPYEVLHRIGGSDTGTNREGMGIITECDTGRMFVITGGGEEGVAAWNEKNWWHLFEVDPGNADQELKFLDGSNEPAFATACAARYAATAFVNEQRQLVIGCNERQPDHSGPYNWADWREWYRF